MDFIKKYLYEKIKTKKKSKQFKNMYSFDERKVESFRIKTKYPDRAPVIVERAGGNNITLLEKKKYLVPFELTIGEFMLLIRKKIKLDPRTGMYLFFNDNILVACSETIGDSYNKYSDSDGFLYIKYSGENTFGEK